MFKKLRNIYPARKYQNHVKTVFFGVYLFIVKGTPFCSLAELSVIKDTGGINSFPSWKSTENTI